MDSSHQTVAAEAVTHTLATFVVASRLDAIPEPVVHEARRALVNWTGCVLGGARHETLNRAVKVLAPASALTEAEILGRGQRVDAMLASLLNSMSASVHVYDDTHPTTVAHPGSPVIAAALATAERTGASGADFLQALLLGIEVCCRVANILVAPPAKSHLGLFMTGIVGGIGAAAAAGKLLGLDEKTLAWAMGSAAAQAAGIRVVHGSDSTPLMPGVAARAGVTSALLAAEGFTSSMASIEGARGLGDVFAENPNFKAAIEGLEEHFELSTLAYKPYPCGIVAHPIIDACLDLAQEPGFDIAAVEQVELRVNPVATKLTGLRKPISGMQSHNSLYHWAAAALILKRAGLDEETDACVADPAVIELRDSIVAIEDDGLAMDQCEADICLRDGTRLHTRIEHCRGSMARPLTDQELEVKFLSQAEMLLDGEAARRVLNACWTVDSLDSMATFTRLAVPSTCEMVRP